MFALSTERRVLVRAAAGGGFHGGIALEISGDEINVFGRTGRRGEVTARAAVISGSILTSLIVLSNCKVFD